MANRGSAKIASATCATIIALIISVVWLCLARAKANRSLEWPAVKATVIDHDHSTDYRGNVTGVTTKFGYSFNGQDYEETLDAYELGEVEIFVDPNDPSIVRLDRGATIVDIAIPLTLLIGSGLFSIFLLLLMFSPKDD